LYQTVISQKKEEYMNIWTYFVYNYIQNVYMYLYSHMKNFLPGYKIIIGTCIIS